MCFYHFIRSLIHNITYDNSGKLHCIICRTVIRTENIWKVHMNTKAHKINLESARKLKDGASNVLPKSEKPNSLQKEIVPNSVYQTPQEVINAKIVEPIITSATQQLTSEFLPEGFFDDPVKDAKIRNTEYKDPQDEEWERFKREIKEESNFSNAIIAGEQDEATVERQLKEIDEQIEKWSKVVFLEKQKELADKYKSEHKNLDKVFQDDQSSEESDSFDEYLNWRSKKIS